MSMMWFYSKADEKRGPVSEQGIASLYRSHAIDERTLVWREGMADWQPLGGTELAAALEIALPGGETWELCAWSGEKCRLGDTVELGGFRVAIQHKDAAVQHLQQGGELPRVAMNRRFSGNLGLAHLLARSFELCHRFLVPAAVIYLLFWVPVGLVTSYIDMFLLDEDDFGRSFRIYNAVNLFIGIIPTGAIYYLYSTHARGRDASIGEALAAGFRNWPRLWVANFGYNLVTIFGFFLLVVPGLIALVRLGLCSVVAVEQQISGRNSLDESWWLTKGHFWRTLGFVLFAGTMTAMPFILLQVGYGFLPFELHWMAVSILDNVATVFDIWLSAFLFVYYKELQARAEFRQTARRL